MSDPVSFKDFCKKYELDEQSLESKADYKKYKENLDFFRQQLPKIN